MPIYEYRCLACKRRTSVFVRSVTSSVAARCEHCGSARLSRLISRFATPRAGLNLNDAGAMDDLDENDPRAVARWAREMKDEMGDDLGPEFDDMITRMESGEDPEAIMSDATDSFAGDEDI